MKYMNRYCADAGTSNCPCPLAETGDCLICSRLSGEERCDCSWCGVCIYNEFIQNDSKARNIRADKRARILRKIKYGPDLVVLEIKVGRGMALNAAMPGSFVFLRRYEDGPFFNLPISVMRSDTQNGTLLLAIKVTSAKSRAVAEAEGSLMVRGIYRNGLLGEGFRTLEKRGRWLIMTRGAGFAPAVNLLDWSEGKADIHLVIDTENMAEELVNDMMKENGGSGAKKNPLKVTMCLLEEYRQNLTQGYDRVFILASDYYIKNKAEELQVPRDKLICSNNFHMCCGEGICGACCHVDDKGHMSKMCKCREMDAKELL